MPLTYPNDTQSILPAFFRNLAQNLVSQWGETKKIIGTALWNTHKVQFILSRARGAGSPSKPARPLRATTRHGAETL